MALVAMATYDILNSGRADLTRRTLESLARTVDWSRHRLFIIDNGSTDPATTDLLANLERNSASADKLGVYDRPPSWIPGVTVIRNGKNLGTAKAINRAWLHRKPGEACVKADNDFTVAESGWLDLMVDCFHRYRQNHVSLRRCTDCGLAVPPGKEDCPGGCGVPLIETWVDDWHPLGILALKRKDLGECPWHENVRDFQTRIAMLPQVKGLRTGERWAFVEKTKLAFGTVQMYSPDLLDKIGFLAQVGVYGFDDSLASVRARAAGFDCCFLPQINITHIDPGNSEYTTWKQEYAGSTIDAYFRIAGEMERGERPLYCGPDEDLK